MSNFSDYIKDSGTVTTHIADSDKHREINDGGVGSTDLWSAQKIDSVSGTLQSAIDGKSNSSHLHDDRYYTETEIDTKIDGVIKQNLLSNSGFGVWSNSTLENVRALPDATSTVVGTTVTSTAHVLTAGMLVKDAAGTPLVFKVISITDVDTFEVDRTGGTNGQWYEVTPGCVAADELACDGWFKDTNLDVWRQHDDTTYTKYGSFYSLKVVSAATEAQIVKINPTDSIWLSRVQGRTLTIGAWCYASDASHLKLEIYNGSSYDTSSYHTGGSSWEWLEVTSDVATDCSTGKVGFRFMLSGKTVYISQPMLVFGSSIGEGNYNQPFGEWVDCEKKIDFSGSPFGAGLSDGASDENLETLSNGKIPKGCKGIKCRLQASDSGSAGSPDCSVVLQSASLAADAVVVYLEGVTNSRYRSDTGILYGNNGEIYLLRNASGAGTLNAYLSIYQVII